MLPTRKLSWTAMENRGYDDYQVNPEHDQQSTKYITSLRTTEGNELSSKYYSY